VTRHNLEFHSVLITAILLFPLQTSKWSTQNTNETDLTLQEKVGHLGKRPPKLPHGSGHSICGMWPKIIISPNKYLQCWLHCVLCQRDVFSKGTGLMVKKLKTADEYSTLICSLIKNLISYSLTNLWWRLPTRSAGWQNCFCCNSDFFISIHFSISPVIQNETLKCYGRKNCLYSATRALAVWIFFRSTALKLGDKSNYRTVNWSTRMTWKSSIKIREQESRIKHHVELHLIKMAILTTCKVITHRYLSRNLHNH